MLTLRCLFGMRRLDFAWRQTVGSSGLGHTRIGGRSWKVGTALLVLFQILFSILFQIVFPVVVSLNERCWTALGERRGPPTRKEGGQRYASWRQMLSENRDSLIGSLNNSLKEAEK